MSTNTMTNPKFKVGDKGKMRGGFDYEITYADGGSMPFQSMYVGSNGRYRTHWHFADGRSNIFKSKYDLRPPTEHAAVDQATDKLQPLLDDLRRARATEHEARKAVAAVKASVKPAEAAYVEAQRQRRKAVDTLLAAMDAQ